MDTPSSPPAAVHEGWDQSSTCRDVESSGRAAGRAYGLAESTSRTLAALLSRQARQKFGDVDPAGRATLDGLASGFATDRLGELGDRLIDVLEVGRVARGRRGAAARRGPARLHARTWISTSSRRNRRSTPTSGWDCATAGRPSSTSASRSAYQPDLDRHLFENSRKVERKHGKMPMVAVFLMWPPAEGPGMTGRFEDRDAAGKVQASLHVYDPQGVGDDGGGGDARARGP